MAGAFLRELTNHAGFVRTRSYNTCNQHLNNEDVNVIVITGTGGSGKTLLGKELFVNSPFVNNANHIVYKLFNCPDLDTFYGDLKQFYEDWAIHEDSLGDQSRGRDWMTLFQTLYTDVNAHEELSTRYKLFIFDYVEKLPEVLSALDNLCRVLKNGPKERRALWKIVVTSQKTPHADKYAHIGGSFERLEGFTETEAVRFLQQSDIGASLAKKIFDTVGSLPLALSLCVRVIELNMLDDEEFVEQFFDLIRDEAVALQGNGLHMVGGDNVLITIKLSIEYLLDDDRSSENSRQLIKMLTFFHESYLFMELVISCAETIITSPKQAKVLAQALISQMKTRGLCTVRKEKDGKVISVNKLVMQAMGLYINESERVELTKNALIALTRVMPEDGRRHLHRFAGYYVEHAKKIDTEIAKMDTTLVNRTDTPLILLLHCNVLARLVYCILSQRIASESGPRRFSRARDIFCELVGKEKYSTLMSQPRDVDCEKIHDHIAEELYAAGQELPMIQSQDYIDFITMLPQYHRLTQKDLQGMVEDSAAAAEFTLVNDHLTQIQRDKFEEKRKILKADKLAPLFVGETLSLVLRAGSLEGENVQKGDRIEQASAVVAVSERICKEHQVFLLSALITERGMLATKLRTDSYIRNARDILSIRDGLSGLLRVDTDPVKVWGYEAGVMKADLSKDSYHRMVCGQDKIYCQGQLFRLSRDLVHYNEGQGMLPDLEDLARKQIYPDSALSYFYKIYAEFLFLCEKFKEATKYIINAMRHLGQHLSRDELDVSGERRSYLEFDNYRFRALYRDLEKYHHKYAATRRERDVLIEPGSAEYNYLRNAVDNMSGPHGQPTDGDARYPLLADLTPEL